MKVWFKAKQYGWGWTPVSWEGWTVLLFLVALFAANSIFFKMYHPVPTDSQAIWFMVRNVLIIAALVAISYWKGEKPKWRWGSKTKDEQK